MEAQLLSTTIPDDAQNDPVIDQIANAALTGALVVHVSAAIISFLAAFFLIRYKLIVANREELEVESGCNNVATSTESRKSSQPTLPPKFSSDHRLEQVGRGQLPTHLLDNCHSLSMWLAMAGFVLALAGVLCVTWARFALGSSVFATACVIVCMVSGIVAFFWPESSAHG